MKNNRIDFSNKRNGSLIAVKYIETIKCRTYWLFKCDCGVEKVLDVQNVFRRRKGTKTRGTLSCGCKTKYYQSQAKMGKDGEAARHNLFLAYKRKCAEERNYEFLLDKNQFNNLLNGPCYYCNMPPSQIKKSKYSFVKYNGIDRVNNSKGYTVQNCVSCCKKCNSAKSGTTIEIAKKMLLFLGETLE